MNKKIHLVVPMSGQGTRFKAAGYDLPKPLIPVQGVPIISHLLKSFPEAWPATFVLAENHRATDLPRVLKETRPNARQFFIPPHTLGPGQALLTALDHIPDDDAVLVSYCDYGMVWDPNQFEAFVRESECDACVISYRGFHAHYLSPLQYAHCRMEGERVVEVKEKGSFTENRENEYASCGAYYFRTARLLRQALEYQARNNLTLNGELYTSLTVQAVIAMSKDARVRVFEIPLFFQWGTPLDLQTYEYWASAFKAYNRFNPSRTFVDQVLMPMAGQGSRFHDLTPVPKPLISIDGQPMFRRALSSLPTGKKTVIVGLESFASECREQLPANAQLLALESTPSGQALSTEVGLRALDREKEVLISACDHSIALDPQVWEKFKAQKFDAAIFTTSGYPGTRRKPEAYAYVRTREGKSGGFAHVTEVSVKKPIAADPSRSELLVGTFWFRTAGMALEAIAELKKRDVRTNGELYLDSVFNILLERGSTVAQIPLGGYLGWGDPASLAETLYWREAFCGVRPWLRPRFIPS